MVRDLSKTLKTGTPVARIALSVGRASLRTREKKSNQNFNLEKPVAGLGCATACSQR
jgi:hypothetical protein